VSVSIGSLIGEIELEDKFSGPFQKIAGALGIGGESFKALAEAAGIAVGAVVGVGAAIYELGMHGSEVAHVSESFDRLTGAMGLSSDAMLGALRSGIKGTMSDFDLMKASNSMLALGLVHSAADMETLGQGAILLSHRTGTTTAEAFNTLSRAMETGRGKALLHAGIMLDSKNAMAAYEAATGKSSATMSMHETATVKAGAVLAALHTALAKAGEQESSFAEKAQQAKVSIENFTNSLAMSISQSPVVMKAMTIISDAISNAFGAGKTEQVQNLTSYVNKFVIIAAEAGVVVIKAGAFITDTFLAIRFLIADVVAKVAGAVGDVAQGLGKLATAASSTPLIGAGYKKLGEALQGVADTAKSVAVGQRGVADEAATASTKAVVAFDKVEKGAQKIVDELKSVDGQLVKIPPSADALKKVAEAAEANAAATKKWKEEQTKAAEELDKLELKGIEAFQKIQDSMTIAASKGINERETKAKIALEDEINGYAREYGAASDTYQKLVTAAKARFDQTKALEKGYFGESATLQRKYLSDIEIANAFGVNQRELVIKAALQRELDGLKLKFDIESKEYKELVALAKTSAQQQLDAANGMYSSVEAAASAAGFASRDEMQKTRDQAFALWQEMKDKGIYTYGELQKAHKRYKDAENVLDDGSKAKAIERFESIAAAASTILTTLFGKNKNAAIAAAIIDAAAAIVKVFAQLGWWGIPAAVAIGAQTYAQIQKIKSTNLAKGTPDTAFMDYGVETPAFLHHDEAVVNKASGETLAQMVTVAATGKDAEILKTLHEVAGLLKTSLALSTAQDRLLPVRLKAAMIDAMA
jgi:hypothetical protein